MQPEVIYTSEFDADATAIISAAADAAMAARGRFRLGLCGGNTPRGVYEQVGTQGGIDWEKVILTFGDERCVPPDHADSNFRMVRDALLRPAGVPADSVFRIRAEMDPEVAAREYEDLLRAQAARDGDGIFTHDLLLLGMGEDGHTASLFPGTAALNENHRLVVANPVPQLEMTRITMTFPLVNTARHICFLVNDPGKKYVVDEIVAGGAPYPAAKVLPAHGRLTWLVEA